MKKLRIVKIPGDQIKIGQPYVMVSVPRKAKLPPGQIINVGQPHPVVFDMLPCRLEFFDDETGEHIPVEMIGDQPQIVVPGGEG